MTAYNVLFLCTGNSARSIIAECIMNDLGRGRFQGYSAGSFPKGQVHPYALDLLRAKGYDVTELRSKSWDEFGQPDAPRLDFVFTVCGHAAEEVCPVWAGAPVSVHWGIPDPAAVEGTDTEKRRAFATAFEKLHVRISSFVKLPIASMDLATLQQKLAEIGRPTADPL